MVEFDGAELKEPMPTYCEVAANDPLHKPYHDREYGFPAVEDDALFERLMLEINQAGLSWSIVLRKRAALRRAYGGFDVDAVAAYGEADRERLMGDPGVVRNRLKVNAAIGNARRLLRLRGEFGSFAGWLNHHHPLAKDEWVRLFKKTFLFTGGEIVGEFLTSTGYLPGAHQPDCPVYESVLASRPPWLRGGQT
ncbi:MAG TPA: DNA-3-methyladenine glycosylase I [Pyrinomonadaceae bacterium]|nr:DNA-3-methyladenine glycosylase I [Pyrinomonadaceae bacterium]